MFRRNTPQPASESQKLSGHMVRAAQELEKEKEQFELVQISLLGLVGYIAECQGDAVLRGSPRAEAFGLLGRAVQGLGAGTARVVAALPPPSEAAVQAVRQMLGVAEPKTVVDVKDATADVREGAW